MQRGLDAGTFSTGPSQNPRRPEVVPVTLEPRSERSEENPYRPEMVPEDRPVEVLYQAEPVPERPMEVPIEPTEF